MSSTTNDTQPRSDVLVVGAGPTGLMASLLLRRAGLAVRILDKNAGPSKESRAAVMSPRSLELFASLGLDDTLLECGAITTEVDFFVSGNEVGGIRYDDVRSPDTPFPFALMIPQSVTERVLIDELAGAGVEVERELEVVQLEQDAKEVRVRARRADQESTLSADYVIGADGAHSIVRSALGLSFKGAKYPESLLLGDVEVDWSLDRERARVFMHGDRVGIFLPLYADRARVMTTDVRPWTSDGDTVDEEPLELAELSHAFGEVARVPVTLRNPRWLTRFRTHHRMVDRYRVGRTFLAGDAAHIHSPAAGQGMNTGLQDAANLAWKITAVFRHGAPDALLDSYESERLPVAREVLRFTDQLFSLAAGQSGWQAKLRDALAPVVVGSATKLGLVQDAVFRKFGQLDVAYGASRAVEINGNAHEPKPGQRAPNAELSRHRDVFDLLSGDYFTLLALSRRPLTKQDVQEILNGLATVARPWCATHAVARLTIGRCDDVEPVERVAVFDRYGLAADDAQALVLVRPDGYVAWRSASLDFVACDDFLSTFGSIAAGGSHSRGSSVSDVRISARQATDADYPA